jgi:hypothetical protein
MAITAPNAMMNRDALSSPAGPDAYCSAVIIGSAVPNVFHGATPVITIEIAMYSTVHTIRLMTMPNGMSFAGLRASSAAVETASNPM